MGPIGLEEIPDIGGQDQQGLERVDLETRVERLVAEEGSFSPRTNLFFKACKYAAMGAFVGVGVSILAGAVVGLIIGFPALLAGAAAAGTVALVIIGAGALLGAGKFVVDWKNTGVETSQIEAEYDELAARSRADQFTTALLTEAFGPGYEI